MIKVSFILDSDPNPTQDINTTSALEAMHAAVDDITLHLEAVGIYPNALDMEESMCIEDAVPAAPRKTSGPDPRDFFTLNSDSLPEGFTIVENRAKFSKTYSVVENGELWLDKNRVAKRAWSTYNAARIAIFIESARRFCLAGGEA
tara:strand:+ start:40 stop:477 length:438 start_codon:yes stop_codon:yes gene_type:complete